MRIAKLYMDPQDKQRFEIQGKSSVKYHLKANHQVEAKRWYWALNNAIQWAKDEAREEEKRASRDQEALKQAKIEQLTSGADNSSVTSSRIPTSRNFPPRMQLLTFAKHLLTYSQLPQHSVCRLGQMPHRGPQLVSQKTLAASTSPACPGKI
jgi:hypothetical protein